MVAMGVVAPEDRDLIVRRVLAWQPQAAVSQAPMALPTAAGPASQLPNPATVLPDPATEVGRATAPAPSKPSTVAPAPVTAAVDLGDPTTWPPVASELVSDVFLARRSQIRLVKTARKGQVTLRNTPLGASGTWPEVNQLMDARVAERFVARFVVPLLKHAVGRQWLKRVMTGRHQVGVLWATGGDSFGLTGTVPLNPKGSSSATQGSPTLIFIDETGRDWKDVPDLDSMPDIGFLHELYHAAMMQAGKNDGMTEREARIEENRYRHQRGASSQRELP